MEDYGIKVSKPDENATTHDRRDLHFTSATSTYLVARKITVTVNSDPYVIIHNLGYIPKVLVYKVLSDHSRRLPFLPSELVVNDFSITKNEVKIRGTSSGTFTVYIFLQKII